jgi:hypothetical protein
MLNGLDFIGRLTFPLIFLFVDSCGAERASRLFENSRGLI